MRSVTGLEADTARVVGTSKYALTARAEPYAAASEAGAPARARV
jgi:hypothetical protein